MTNYLWYSGTKGSGGQSGLLDYIPGFGQPGTPDNDGEARFYSYLEWSQLPSYV